MSEQANRQCGSKPDANPIQPKFTPGPWRAYTGHSRPVIATKGGSVAQLSPGRMGSPYATQMTRDESLANAHLIAAAPEMHAKLVAIRDAHTCVCRLNEVVAPLGAAIPCTRCELEALLAKAEGRSL